MAPQLKAEEREVISQMLTAGETRKAIARALGRAESTIFRELRRNSLKGYYFAVDAQRCAEQRRQEARRKSCKLARPENLGYVQERLRQYWSPDQIAGRSRLDFLEDSRRQFSHQTIYNWLARDDHQRRWIVYLRHYRRRKRRAKSSATKYQGLAQRPAVINERARCGDWEGDTIVGAYGRGSVLITLVDRQSGYLALLPAPNRKATPVQRAICGRLQQLPPDLRHSLTFDNGSEFAAYAAMENALGLNVYFADPHSPWQRGTNENTNGLVRQFFPKGTDLGEASRYKVSQVESLLNNRPRKRLNYQTPSEVLLQNRYRAFQT